MQSEKHLFSVFIAFDVIIGMLLLMLLFVSVHFFSQAFAASPAFEPQAISDQRKDWIQTFGNESLHLRHDYPDLLEADYLSDGKTLKVTLWLASNSENASTYNQPFKRISYGILIKIASYNINTGFNGADYNYYIEAINGKWNEYLYQLSSTGNQVLLHSKTNYTETFGGPTIGPGYVKLQLNLSSIDNPSEYGILFYTKESAKTNEVRDFTNWVGVPPSTITIETSPKDIVIRQGEQQLIPADILSTFSNNVTGITFNNGNNSTGSDFDARGLHVSIQRIQPPLFKITVSPQTPVGIYTIPFTTSIFMDTTLESMKPISNQTTGESANPEIQASKKYPTIGFITNPSMNLTITVIPPLSLENQFKNFWDTYGQPISIIMGGFAGGFASLVFGRIRKNNNHSEHKEDPNDEYNSD